ncbi:blast:Mannosyl-oligosaccharide alpha-1%2C2-mannosidase isoform B, partial [Drosophila guanche]
MCPKTSKTTPLLLIGGIGFVIVLVGITGITLINNINLSNIIRLNEKVASDSVSASDNQIKELNYVNNHPKNIYLKLNDTLHADDDHSDGDDDDVANGQQRDEAAQEPGGGVMEPPKVSAVIGSDPKSYEGRNLNQNQTTVPASSAVDSSASAPSAAIPAATPPSVLPLGWGKDMSNASSAGLIDYEKRARVVQ